MTFVEVLCAWRREWGSRLPFVRRREHRHLQRRYAELIEDLGWSAPPAAQARLQPLKPLGTAPAGEICLFASQASQPALKPWVVAHVDHLLRAGVRVVLMLNSALPAEHIEVDAALLERLDGVYVRENVGFEFAAWAHAFDLCEAASAQWTRLYLVSDSIVGPLNQGAFDRLMQRVRLSAADVVGLTEIGAPLPHLQCHFLALNASALRHPALCQAMRRILSLPSRGQVHEVYETRLTPWLTDHGLRCEALFAAMPQERLHAQDAPRRWARLVRAGLPYVGTAALARPGADALLGDQLPPDWLAADG